MALFDDCYFYSLSVAASGITVYNLASRQWYKPGDTHIGRFWWDPRGECCEAAQVQDQGDVNVGRVNYVQREGKMQGPWVRAIPYYAVS